ncbi:MAG TPA: DUF87 domain-containing protein, partial [Candidatus Absconditabacterales bacterium]|nr:DUF87 domain-containing protein [Candidatus Absconditabacterales bacterium]
TKDSPASKSDQSVSEHLMVYSTVGYKLSQHNKGIEQTIQSNYNKLSKKGFFKRGNNESYSYVSLSQIINYFHIPAGAIFDGLEYVPYRKLQYPNNLPSLENIPNKNDLTVIGKTEYRGNNVVFGITREDKLRHTYIIGKTGVGKSNLIANLARSDMVSNKGICVIDPHGDLIDDIIAQVPSYRINDVVLFDVADRERPVGFNVLEHEKPEEKTLIASGIVSIFKKLFGNSRGPRLEYILRNVILSVLEYPNATLMHVLRMLTDDNFRQEVLEYVKDPVIMKFRRDEFEARQPRQREEAVAPITNKVGQFTSSQIIRNIFGQSTSKINFRKLMDEGKIILVNLSKGKIGEDSTNLLGSFIVSKIQIDAMSRADMDESMRKDFYLYIDEFQNFATESFATILSEARKYKLGLIVANQYSSQLDEVTRGAIFGNVGTIISMTLGYDDAVIMANQFKGLVSANDFLDIPKYKAYIKLMIHGVVSDPFNIQTIALPPGEDVEMLKEKIRKQSRSRYAISRKELEELIEHRASRSFSKTEKAVLKAKEAHKSKGVKEIISPSLSGSSSNKTPTHNITHQESTIKQSSSPTHQVVNSGSNEGVISYQGPTPERLNYLWEHNTINGVLPDAILRDSVKAEHKVIFYTKPSHMESIATLHGLKPKGGWYIKGERKIYQVFLDMYERTDGGLTIRVGSHDEVLKQIDHGFTNSKKRKLYVRLSIDTTDGLSSKYIKQHDNQTKLTNPEEEDKTTPQVPEQTATEVINPPHQEIQDNSTITEYSGIKIGKTYEGFVKLKYNYGLFVTVGELDGLLHKSQVECPEGLSRKKLYEIGDPIIVKATEIKELDGRITVVWTQM